MILIKRHWDSSAITPRHDCWVLSPYYIYIWLSIKNLCICQIPYSYIPFKIPFSGDFPGCFLPQTSAGCVRLCYIELSVFVITAMCNTGLNIGQPGRYPVSLTGHFQLNCCILNSCVKKQTNKKKSRHLRIAYQPVCLSIISTMLQVNDNIDYCICMYVCMCHLRSLFFCNILMDLFIFLRLHIYGTLYRLLFGIVFLFVTQYCFAWSGDNILFLYR